jgi:hypothetical protein
MIVAPPRPCSVCGKTTWRGDGVCDDCWKARQLIETSPGMAMLTKIVLDCEADWRLLDRIDWDQRAS